MKVSDGGRRTVAVHDYGSTPSSVHGLAGGRRSRGLGRADFSRAQQIFAMARTGDGRLSVSCKARRGVQDILVTSEPGRYYVPAYTGHNGWIGIWLDVDDDWDPVEDAILESYRMTAPKKLAAAIQNAARE